MKGRKIFSFLFAGILLLSAFSSPVYAQSDEPQVPPITEYAGDTADQFRSSFSYYDDVDAMLIGEPTTGKILLEKNSDTPMAIASMTKLMTYYIVKSEIEAGSISPSDEVTVSEEAEKFNIPESSNYGLVAGETRTVEQLLTGMMVVSGNDAAAQLAEVVSGSEEAFADRMNEEAKNLGMTHAHYVNASGYTVEGEYSTASARDLFVLTMHILRRFPEVKDYANFKSLSEPERYYEGESTLTETTVDLPGMTGLKTGTTDEAGYCFTGTFDLHSIADQTPFEAVTVVMGAPSNDARWRTTKELVDLAEGSFSYHSIVDAAKPIGRYEMPSSVEQFVTLYPAESLSTFTYANKAFDVRYHIESGIAAPTEENAKFGEIEVYQDGSLLKTVDVIAHTPTTKANWFLRLRRSVQGFLTFVFRLIG